MFLLLLLFWIVLNGKITLEILLTGVVLSAALCWVSGKLCGWSFRRELQMLALLPRLVRYFFLLLWNILLSNLLVIREALRPRVHIAPSIVTMRTPLKGGLTRFILANCITLTPGTITVRIDDEHMVVHALNEKASRELSHSPFIRELEKWEGQSDTD